MATTIKLKNGSGAPLASDLVQGEPAFDLTNKRLYTEDSGGTVIEVGVNPSNLTAGHNGSTKLTTTSTGIDVTGTVVADGLTVDGASTITQATDTPLTIAYNGSNSSSYGYYQIVNNNTGNPFEIHTGGSKTLRLEANGDVSLYEDTGTTAKFFWDASAESLGIGTTTPVTNLQVYKATGGLSGVQISNSTHGSTLTDGLFVGIDNSVSYLYNYEAIPLVFGTSGTERLRIFSSGRVGIGSLLDAASIGKVVIGQTGDTDGLGVVDSAASFTTFLRSNNTAGVGIVGTNGPQPMTIAVNNAERMRIDSSGTVLIGTTDSDVTNNTTGEGANIFSTGTVAAASTSYCLDLNRTNSTVGEVARFRKQGTQVGSITVTASATAYNITSDYRLKENVVPMDDASSRVLALKPCRFNFIADPDKTVDGFLAHEAQEVVPEAVHGTKDAMRTEEYEVSPAVLDDEGNVVTEAVMGTREVPEYQGIDQSKLVPLLTKALQEALERIAALEAKVG